MAAFLFVPLVAALVGAAIGSFNRPAAFRRFTGIGTSIAILVSGIALSAAALASHVESSVTGLLRADALSSYMLCVIGAVALTATWGGIRGSGKADGGRVYNALICAFLGAMSLAVLADNLGIMWVAIELTTIATAFLVGHARTGRALEAAWKYVILGSVGVAIAFLGIVLLYAATRESGSPTLSWLELDQGNLALNPALVKAAAALAVLGFATKAGLAPMHSWLPDAHSQAPAPVSGLMSGVLLAVAFYAVLRIQSIADAVLGPDLMRGMLAVGGLLSLAVAAALLIGQRDYKRMLAYSSVEHMGLMALGAAAGGVIGLTAVLLHILGHGLTKSSLFVVSGRIQGAEGTTTISDVRGLLTRRPGLGVPFLIAMVALLGFPPFSLFFSEVGILIAAWTRGMGWVTGIALVLLLVVFAALARLTARLAFGAPEEAESSEPLVDTSSHGPRTPLIIALSVTAVIAFVAVPLGSLLSSAVAVLSGGS